MYITGSWKSTEINRALREEAKRKTTEKVRGCSEGGYEDGFCKRRGMKGGNGGRWSPVATPQRDNQKRKEKKTPMRKSSQAKLMWGGWKKINRAANKSVGTPQEEERKIESVVKIKPTTSAIKRLVSVGSLSGTDSKIKEGGPGMIHLTGHILMRWDSLFRRLELAQKKAGSFFLKSIQRNKKCATFQSTVDFVFLSADCDVNDEPPTAPQQVHLVNIPALDWTHMKPINSSPKPRPPLLVTVAMC